MADVPKNTGERTDAPSSMLVPTTVFAMITLANTVSRAALLRRRPRAGGA